jgi:hypothetical protein
MGPNNGPACAKTWDARSASSAAAMRASGPATEPTRSLTRVNTSGPTGTCGATAADAGNYGMSLSRHETCASAHSVHVLQTRVVSNMQTTPRLRQRLYGVWPDTLARTPDPLRLPTHLRLDLGAAHLHLLLGAWADTAASGLRRPLAQHLADVLLGGLVPGRVAAALAGHLGRHIRHGALLAEGLAGRDGRPGAVAQATPCGFLLLLVIVVDLRGRQLLERLPGSHALGVVLLGIFPVVALDALEQDDPRRGYRACR